MGWSHYKQHIYYIMQTPTAYKRNAEDSVPYRTIINHITMRGAQFIWRMPQFTSEGQFTAARSAANHARKILQMANAQRAPHPSAQSADTFPQGKAGQTAPMARRAIAARACYVETH